MLTWFSCWAGFQTQAYAIKFHRISMQGRLHHAQSGDTCVRSRVEITAASTITAIAIDMLTRLSGLSDLLQSLSPSALHASSASLASQCCRGCRCILSFLHVMSSGSNRRIMDILQSPFQLHGSPTQLRRRNFITDFNTLVASL